MYRYGLVGNCQASALIHENGSVDWLCLPRPDSAPVFGRLLDPEGGHFSIETEGAGQGRTTYAQDYIPNTNVLTTTIRQSDGSALRITDFCPRFLQHGRIYRPLSLFRILEPIAGAPRIAVACKPVDGWSKEPARQIRGNSHLCYELSAAGGSGGLRVTTNMPLTYLCEGAFFSLQSPVYIALSWDLAIETDIATVTRSFLDQTLDYWKTWVKQCSIPTLWQKETIRSALALKLHCYEDTGAILAALTTSLPEEAGRGRNWDYRFCWLRDAYFVLTAFYNLGHFEELEGFLKFLLSIAEKHEDSHQRLRPVYRLDQTLPLPEIIHSGWRGFAGEGPVRSGNQAAEHVQNDVYGEMALALTPIFLDQRFASLRGREHEELLSHLARLCAIHVGMPDAGLWELRDGWREHTFSNLMCWAGIERTERIRQLGFARESGAAAAGSAELLRRAEASVRAAVKDGALLNGPCDETLDSALLLAGVLRFPDAKLAATTIRRIQDGLRIGPKAPSSSFLYRYLRKDDFGQPKSSFLACSFWLAQALARVGQIDEARQVLEHATASANAVGLFPEHYRPETREQTGNFPQAYSHVGQINAAFAVSPPWSELL